VGIVGDFDSSAFPPECFLDSFGWHGFGKRCSLGVGAVESTGVAICFVDDSFLHGVLYFGLAT
jgi:hypothetical protein